MNGALAVDTLGLAMLVVGCSPGTPAEQEGPLALLTPAVHDAGVVPFGASVEHRFELVNRSSEEVPVDILRTSCGCSGAEVVPERIPPGSRATVVVRFEVDSRFGSDIRVLLASSRFPGRVLADLHVLARVDGSDRVLVQPRVLQLRGTTGSPVWAETVLVRCQYRGGQAPELSIAAPAWLETEIASTRTETLGDGRMERRFTIEARVDVRGKTPGEYRAEILFSTSEERLGAARAALVLEVPGVYRAEPPELFLGSGIDGVVARQIDLHALQPGAEVESVACDDERFVVGWVDSQEGDARRLEVVFDPTLGAARERGQRLVAGEITLTYRPQGPPLVIPIIGWLENP